MKSTLQILLDLGLHGEAERYEGQLQDILKAGAFLAVQKNRQGFR